MTREIINESATEEPEEIEEIPLPPLDPGLYFYFDNDYPDRNTNTTTSSVSYVGWQKVVCLSMDNI